LAQLANPGKALTTSALRFSATAAGKTSITLTGVKITSSFAGYTGTLLVRVYKESTIAANLAGTYSFDWATDNATSLVVPMTSNSSANSVIDA